MKKSFVIYVDALDILDELSSEEISELFLAIRSYHRGEKLSLSPIVKIAFFSFKSQFERDSEKYQKTCEARKEAGSKGGKQKVANASKSKQDIANVADNDNDNDTDTDDVIVINIFNSFRNKYPGTVKGLEVEFKNFKKHKNWKEVLPLLEESIDAQILENEQFKIAGEFAPSWKNLQTWINQSCWTQETREIEKDDEYLKKEFNSIKLSRFREKYGVDEANRISQLLE